MNKTVKTIFGVTILFFISVIGLSLIGTLAFGYGLGDLYYLFFILIWTILLTIGFFIIRKLDFQKSKDFGIAIIIILPISIIYTINLFTFSRGPEFKWDGHILLSSANSDYRESAREIVKNNLIRLDNRIKNNPNDYEAYYNKGLTYRHQGLFKESIAEYESAIKINPQYFDAYRECAISYSLIEKYEKAVELYEKASLIDTSNTEVKLVIMNLKSYHHLK